MAVILPTFTFFAPDVNLVEQWQQNLQSLVSQDVRSRISVVHSTFEELKMHFDCVVSPANSFGRFDGGFDQVLSDTLAPADDCSALTRVAQTILYKRWRGCAPPGTCTLIPLCGTPCFPNPYECRFIAMCPTMRSPSSVTWHREIVYNCVWSLLIEIDHHNARAQNDPALSPITSVGMTGLATGIGGVAAAVCARQTALAFLHHHDATSHPDKWTNLSWEDIQGLSLNVRLPMDD